MKVKIQFEGREPQEIETTLAGVVILEWAIDLINSYGIPAEVKKEEENNERTRLTN
jgi:hypothetical protein